MEHQIWDELMAVHFYFIFWEWGKWKKIQCKSYHKKRKFYE